jgi:hypothetical protein
MRSRVSILGILFIPEFFLSRSYKFFVSGISRFVCSAANVSSKQMLYTTGNCTALLHPACPLINRPVQAALFPSDIPVVPSLHCFVLAGIESINESINAYAKCPTDI